MTVSEGIAYVQEHEDTVISHARAGCQTAINLLTVYWAALSEPLDYSGQADFRAALEAWKTAHE